MQMPDSMLSPDLHVARCRLRKQVEERGSSAHDGELHMEQYMRNPKKRVQADLVSNPDHTWLRHREMNARVLRRSQVEHGCVSGYDNRGVLDDTDDLADHVHSMQQLVRKGLMVTKRVRVPKYGLLPESTRLLVQRICAARDGRKHLVAEHLDWILVLAHHSARTVGCIFH